MANAATVIDFLLMLAMGGLAGLVIALHLKLRQFSTEAMRVPALADDLARAITASRATMKDLMKAARTDGVRLEDLNTQSERNRQELVYVLDRAEKVLAQFDQHLAGRPVPQPQAAVVNPQPEEKTPTPNSRVNAGTKAAIMPGRYKVDENPQPPEKTKPYKPASFQNTAAAYGSAHNTSSAGQTAEELRRALESTF